MTGLSVVKGSLVVAATLAAMLLMGSVASAVPIDDVELQGAGPTFWDVTARDPTGCLNQKEGFTPVDDGIFAGNPDAFDNGLVLFVNGVPFRDPDDQGQLSGEQLTVGPGSAGGLRVVRIERALQGSPTLRSLISFQNRRDTRRVVRIQWDSGLGSDFQEEVRGTSDGDATLELTDRWLVTSDDPVNASLDDPPLVFVLWGQNAGVRTLNFIHPPGDGCFTISMRIRVPANSKRYLLFFTEMHDDSNGAALSSALKFNNVGPASPLLNGIGPKVRNRIMNWNL
jgi:hypothetical protein